MRKEQELDLENGCSDLLGADVPAGPPPRKVRCGVAYVSSGGGRRESYALESGVR